MNKKVVILGAGLAGLSCARHLPQDLDYGIYEKETSVGGLCRTVAQDGFLFDYTGHLLHLRHQKITSLILSLLKNNLSRINRHSWIYSHQTYSRYPFQANTYGLPAAVIKECVLGFIEARLKDRYNKKDEPDFYSWVIKHFGAGIGRHFMFGYNEKLWTVPVKKLSAEWIGRYVPDPSLAEVITGAFLDQAGRVGYNANFWYPKHHGIQALPQALAGTLKNINLQETAQQLYWQERLIRFSSGREVKYERLVSSLSLADLMKISVDLPAAIKKEAVQLRFNEVLNINIGVKPALGSAKHWIYFPEKQYPFYRVGYNSNFSQYNHPAGTSSLYLEVASPAGSLVAQNKQQTDRVVNNCLSKLKQIGILKSNSQLSTLNVLKISPAYCIYDFNRGKSVRIIRKFLAKQGIYSIGRYGAWEYSAMEDALEWGRKTAAMIKSG
ncbi:MAG: FAD-dependent oxidoreductase [Elusimicrobia bacterium]|nr:FAD-dependent oxidoreductase [Elusimicrobiota bacterium]